MNRLLFLFLLALILGLAFMGLRTRNSEVIDLVGSESEDVGRSSDEPMSVPTLREVADESTREQLLPSVANAAVETYSVRVEVKQRKWASGPLIPNVRVQLGIDLYEKEGPKDTALTVDAQVDESGSALVELAVPVRFLGDEESNSELTRVVWGMVTEPGYSRRVKRVVLPEDSNDEISLVLAGTVGGTIQGRVLRPDGVPASYGTVILCELNEEHEFSKTREREKIGADGTFRIHFRREGDFALHAMAGRVGAVTSEVQQLSGLEFLEFELKLEGSGIIAGRVVGADKKPFPKHRLWIAPASASSRAGFDLKGRIRKQWEGGLVDERVTTDDEGRFRTAGLQPGAYIVYGYDQERAAYSQLLTEQAALTDELDLELVVSGQRLVLHILDVNGESLESLGLRHSGREWLGGKSDLYVEPCDSDGRITSRIGTQALNRSRLESGEVVVDVKGDRSYLVGVVSRDARLEEHVVYVPGGKTQTEHTIQLAASEPETSLKVRVLDEDGTPFKRYCQVRVFAPGSGRLLLETGRNNRKPEFTAKLGHGTYRIAVSAEPGRGHHGERIGKASHAAYEEIVEVVPGHENVFDMRLLIGGRLKIAIDSDPEMSLPTVQLPEDRLGADGVYHLYSGGEGERLSRRGVAVRLEPIEGEIVVWPLFDLTKPEAKQPYRFGRYNMERSWVPIGGAAETLTRIPAGEYTLVLSPPGFREVRRRVLIEADKVVKVDVTLTQQDLAD